MEQSVYEGTWEEVASHGAELVGRRVRLTIVEEPSSSLTLDRTLADILIKAELLATSESTAPGSEDTEEYSAGTIEKFQRQGFSL